MARLWASLKQKFGETTKYPKTNPLPEGMELDEKEKYYLESSSYIKRKKRRIDEETNPDIRKTYERNEKKVK